MLAAVTRVLTCLWWTEANNGYTNKSISLKVFPGDTKTPDGSKFNVLSIQPCSWIRDQRFGYW